MDDKKKVADLTIKSATFSFFLFFEKTISLLLIFCIKIPDLCIFMGKYGKLKDFR